MKEKEFAIEVAKQAGELLLNNYGKMQKLEWKLRTNFKTKVDDMSNDLIIDRIRKEFPKDAIYSEEQDPLNREQNRKWVIDPLDGTIPYRYGITDHFSVCIALIEGKTPILGVIYAPKREELYVAEKNRGAFCNGKRIKVNLENNLNHSLIGMDAGKDSLSSKRNAISKYYHKLLSEKGVTYVVSSACASVPLALTASGKLNGYFGLSLEPWDMAAGVVINREAGAKVTNLKGEEWNLEDPSILVANPPLHTKIMNFISE